MLFRDMFQYNGCISCDQISAWWHIGMYLAPIESATVLSTSETAIRDHKSVPIPKHRKLIGSDSDNRVPHRNLDAFPYKLCTCKECSNFSRLPGTLWKAKDLWKPSLVKTKHLALALAIKFARKLNWNKIEIWHTYSTSSQCSMLHPVQKCTGLWKLPCI